jgi:SNF2 family DNA or RNA helicase
MSRQDDSGFAAIRLLNAETAQTSLIVVPAGLVRQWRRQLRDWAPELKLSTIVGTAEERSKAWQTRADVFITSYESIRSDLAIRAPYDPGLRSWDIVVIDEADLPYSRLNISSITALAAAAYLVPYIAPAEIRLTLNQLIVRRQPRVRLPAQAQNH